MDQEQLVLICLFGVVAFAGYGLCRLFVPRNNEELEKRLQHSRPAASHATSSSAAVLSSLLTRIGRTAGKPFHPRTQEEQSALRRDLGYAGLYTSAAVHFLSGAKAISLAAGLVGGYVAGLAMGRLMLYAAMGGVLGVLLPTWWLRVRIKKQQRALEHGLPDALDLMVVCVEAGLTVDAAMQRVGNEIAMPHPALSRELAITHMETQMGLPRSEALRNLGRRTGSAALQSLAAMLIQAERFGTSIAQALRIHAESLRVKRQYAAEEVAAKASVKITFPLVMCIFPAMLIVIGGPAVIKLMNSGFIK
jgi:tight adherence protein C